MIYYFKRYFKLDADVIKFEYVKDKVSTTKLKLTNIMN
jgi:hypothetical protein